ncbi:hypothetical protein [Yinghuangia soli]|uniref:Uncharacterized protein n=1 Tax=Yinghuangia soli TaxID=2908204 RepID=A0AA41Q7B0_9ACTN|nr:hypothetical protein [Yinghuangia soli]MCF2532265.1 hypothetical protein [Yinghuangia soli]
MAVSDGERHEQRRWHQEFAAALAKETDTVPGLAFYLPADGMPALRWEDDPRGAYGAFAGLVAGGHAPLTKATATLHYRRDPADGEGPFERDEQLLSTLDLGTTDPRLAAAILVTGARHHRATLQKPLHTP